MNRIKDWPEAERPREKLLSRGASSLSDAELLALIIRNGDASSKNSALDMARMLLARFGSLREMGRASTAELCAQPGIGPAKSAELQALFEVGRRLQATNLERGHRYSNSREIFEHFHSRFCDYKREVFVTLMLDAKNRIIREQQVSEGSLTSSIVHPREVFSLILRESAAAVIFVHNHPSGDPNPSQEDLEITRRLKEAGDLMGVRVLDHVIIGAGDYVSFADRGLLG